MNINWESRLFRANLSRGLSGGQSTPKVAFEKEDSFYNFRLRRHQTNSSILNEPLTLWGLHEGDGPSRGLADHIANEAYDNLIDFTDVLIVLSRADYAQADESWLKRAEQVLTFSFSNFCEVQGIGSPFPQRPLGVHILCDGSEELNGHEFGLKRNEFISGLMPNLYRNPMPNSQPELTIHIAIPSAWSGFREIGSLYNDQTLFTIGNHWLDNFQHAALKEPAVYQIYRDEQDDFRHMINPDLHGEYVLSQSHYDGIDLVVIADRSGDPIAYISLTLSGTITTSLDAAVTLDEAGGESIIPKPHETRIFGLRECGALLQKVHFKRFMDGYDVYLSRTGDLSTISNDVAATFEVRRAFVALSAEIDSVILDGKPLSRGESVELTGEHVIELTGHRIEYSSLRSKEVDGWPYVGEIRRSASSTYIPFGEVHQIGRSRECRIVLPDQTNNTNIKWLDEVGAGAMIQSKSGEIPKAKFSTDSIMVGSMHGQIDLTGPLPVLSSVNRNCFTFIRRGRTIHALHPTKSKDEIHEGELRAGDELLVGNCLYRIAFETPGQTTPPIPAPSLYFEGAELDESDEYDDVPESANQQESDFFNSPTPISASPRSATPEPPPISASAEALSEHGQPADDDFISFDDREEADPVDVAESLPELPVAETPRSFELDDIPAAAGLGEVGAAPAPLAFDNADSYDSIIGDSYDDLRFEAQEILKARKAEIDESVPLNEEAPQPVARDEISEFENIVDTNDEYDEFSPPPSNEWEFSEESEAVETPASEDELKPVSQFAPPPAFDPKDEHEEEITQPAAPVSVEPSSTAPETPSSNSESTEQAHPNAAAQNQASDGWGDVLFVPEGQAQFELGRSMHIVQVGWMLNGTSVVGNHSNCEIIIPESQLSDEQDFTPMDYLAVKVRGRRGSVHILEKNELYVNGNPPDTELFESLEGLEIEVIRRDDQLEEDFTVRLSIQPDRTLPDPRAQFLTIDIDDPLTGSLFTKGLPTRTEREIQFGHVSATLLFDGTNVTISNYLETYRDGDSFRPFFVQNDGGRFKTAPEDGTSITVNEGDKLIVGKSIYLIKRI